MKLQLQLQLLERERERERKRERFNTILNILSILCCCCHSIPYICCTTVPPWSLVLVSIYNTTNYTPQHHVSHSAILLLIRSAYTLDNKSLLFLCAKSADETHCSKQQAENQYNQKQVLFIDLSFSLSPSSHRPFLLLVQPFSIFIILFPFFCPPVLKTSQQQQQQQHKEARRSKKNIIICLSFALFARCCTLDLAQCTRT